MISSLYIHIPFCMQKCHYCDFPSFGSTGEGEYERYLEALKTEIRIRKEEMEVIPRTIFIGGGTPSLLNEPLLEDLLAFVAESYHLESIEEYTIECNPGTLTRAKLELMKKYGVNRLSIGVQSDRDEVLKLLGRIHNFDEVRENYLLAREVGFQNISLDLMYGVQDQTLEQWNDTLDNVLGLEPNHISLYQLKIEDGTVFERWYDQGKIEEFDDEVAAAMFDLAEAKLAELGYHHYEISNYGLNGKESAHNKVYWQTQGYLGIGWGAHSFLPPVRINYECSYDQYIESLQQGKLPDEEKEVLSKQHQMEEMMFMGLRMTTGVSFAEFEKRYGCKVKDVFQEAIADGKKKQLLVEVDGWLRLTAEGRKLGNEVFASFLT